MTDSWTLAVKRADLAATTIEETPVPELAEGEALLRVDRVGVTANNITYAVLGDSFRYWEFFPPAARGLDGELGLPPLWGFAEVVASTVPGVEVGQRYYGYYPPATHLVVQPVRVDGRGFRDGAAHRAELPSPYNVYALTTNDAAYEADREDLLILFRPLFFTSFMLADQLVDNDYYGAEVLAVSSASSKTAYAAAFELHGKGPKLVGLTSPGNVEFTRALGCYDEVLSYDEIGTLDAATPTAYIDLAGRQNLRDIMVGHFGDKLAIDLAVGLTNQVSNVETAQTYFFAPVQMRKRTGDWGREGLDAKFAEAWGRFSAFAEKQVDVVVSEGSEGLRTAWLDVLNGTAAPRTGHVISL